MITTAIQTLTTCGVVGHQGDKRAGHHDLVGQRIEQHAHGGDLAALARQVAVQAVGDRGQHKQNRGQDLLLARRPCHGKCGERIHSSSGIMTIRLIVMELGRFTCALHPGGEQ